MRDLYIDSGSRFAGRPTNSALHEECFPARRHLSSLSISALAGTVSPGAVSNRPGAHRPPDFARKDPMGAHLPVQTLEIFRRVPAA